MHHARSTEMIKQKTALQEKCIMIDGKATAYTARLVLQNLEFTKTTRSSEKIFNRSAISSDWLFTNIIMNPI